jgi:ribose 5-phosphate isomerase B
VIGPALAFEVVEAFVKASFIVNEVRFTRRFNKVLAIEARYQCGDGSASSA